MVTIRAAEPLKQAASSLTRDPTLPGEAGAARWKRIVRTAVAGYRRGGEHNMSLIAAGVAFYGFLALVPTAIAATLVYGLVTNPEDVQAQVDSLAGVLPTAAQDLLTQMLNGLTETSTSSLSIGLVVALVLALSSASGGVGNLVTALNIAYAQHDDRNFVVKKVLAVALTLGAVVFFAATMTLVAVLPAVADSLDLGWALRTVVEILRWVALLAVLMLAIGVLYRVGPDHHAGPQRWVTPGALGAVVLWLVASVGFSIYADNFSSYSATYGTLAGVVVIMLWLWLSVYAVLLGAEMDAVHRAPRLEPDFGTVEAAPAGATTTEPGADRTDDDRNPAADPDPGRGGPDRG